MPREVNRLSDRKVRSIKTPGRYADGGNLYLSVAGNSKSWTFLYRRRGDGKPTEMGLGAYPSVSLAAAREKAARARLLILEGKDPRAAKLAAEAQLGAPTFENVAEELHATLAPGFRNKKHRKQWLAQVKRHAKSLLGKRVNEIATPDVLNALKAVWHVNAETGSRVRQRIERVLDLAKALGHRDGDNPARWRGNLDIALPHPKELKKVRHQPALPYAEIPDFMTQLRDVPGTDARALEFAILTCLRTDEILSAQWPEFDIESALWSIPGPRMKAKIPHRVPLCRRALAILEDMKPLRRGEYVFPGRKRSKPRCDSALRRVVKKIRPNITTHGFRSSFRDWVHERTDFPGEIAEAALAHAVGDKTERAYRRGEALDRRREVMNSPGDLLRTKATTGDKAQTMILMFRQCLTTPTQFLRVSRGHWRSPHGKRRPE